MSRPMEVFLYDWWPIRADAQLADRLSAMPVRISYKTDANPEAWRSDWPAAPPPAKPLATAEQRSPAIAAQHLNADDVRAFDASADRCSDSLPTPVVTAIARAPRTRHARH